MRKPKAGTRKRKAAPSPNKEGERSCSRSSEEPVKDGAVKDPAIKRRRKPALRKEQEEPEYFPEKRNLEDLWEAAFPVGTEWHNLDALKEVDWKFTNLEDAFEEGGELHGKNVYLFGGTEPQLLVINNEQKVACIPVVVAVVSPFPPSDKVGIKSIQRVEEEIIPMKAMKLAWVPYIPLENRFSQVDRLKTQIFTMGCVQRRSALKHLKDERIKQYEYCLPYFYNPLKQDEDEEDTVVSIIYPSEPPIVRDFDYELDELEEFTDGLVSEEVLPEDQKEAFKQFVKEQVRERKKSQRQAKEARRKATEEMDEQTKTAFENMRFYKFYPVQTPNTPDISQVKSAFINRYYGRAHAVL